MISRALITLRACRWAAASGERTPPGCPLPSALCPPNPAHPKAHVVARLSWRTVAGWEGILYVRYVRLGEQRPSRRPVGSGASPERAESPWSRSQVLASGSARCAWQATGVCFLSVSACACKYVSYSTWFMLARPLLLVQCTAAAALRTSMLLRSILLRRNVEEDLLESRLGERVGMDIARLFSIL